MSSRPSPVPGQSKRKEATPPAESLSAMIRQNFRVVQSSSSPQGLANRTTVSRD